LQKKGLDYFDGAEIRDLILGKRSDTFNFVGGPLVREDAQPAKLHHLSFRRHKGLLTVVVHLFASFYLKPYEIVVGKINQIE
jgi:hypothetical protein